MTINTSVKVLVVDDFASMRRIIKGALKLIGIHDIIEAENGEEALKKLKKEKIGLIVSDWYMPNMNGLDLLKIVKGDKTLKNIPFLMVTTEGQKDSVIEAIQSGVNNYVVKPFTQEIFIEKLEKLFD